MGFSGDFGLVFVVWSVCGVVFLIFGDFVLHACWPAEFLTGDGGCLDCDACKALRFL